MIASSETIEASAPSSGPQGMKPRLKSGLSSLGPLGRMMVAKDRAKETPHSEFWLLTPEFCRFVAKASWNEFLLSAGHNVILSSQTDPYMERARSTETGPETVERRRPFLCNQ